jgi:iron complex outermembrane receptor protein
VLPFGERVSFVPALRWEIVRDDFPADPRVAPALRTGGTSVQDFFSPHCGLRVEVGRGLTLLGNVGRYTRVPNLEELFGDRGVVVGNPDLKPEVARTGDVGFRLVLPALGRVVTGAGLEAAFFDNQIDDLIVLRLTTASVSKPENVSAAHVRGQEVVARARLWGRLGASVNYTHQDAQNVGDDPKARGQLPGLPADEAYARLDLDWSPAHPLPLGAWAAPLWPGRLFFDVDLIAGNVLNQAASQPDVPENANRRVGSRAYFGVGLELALALPGVRLALEVKNAGDDHTRDVFGFPLPGRTLFATVSWGFRREAGSGR